MLKQFPTGIVSCVGDSYDMWRVCDKVWGQELKGLVEAREGKGTLVVRPDSGYPPDIVVKVKHCKHNNKDELLITKCTC